MKFTVIWFVAIVILIATWVMVGEIVPQPFGPVYFALPFITVILAWLFSKAFKK
jgi:hypothetical protein